MHAVGGVGPTASSPIFAVTSNCRGDAPNEVELPPTSEVGLSGSETEDGASKLGDLAFTGQGVDQRSGNQRSRGCSLTFD